MAPQKQKTSLEGSTAIAAYIRGLINGGISFHLSDLIEYSSQVQRISLFKPPTAIILLPVPFIDKHSLDFSLKRVPSLFPENQNK